MATNSYHGFSALVRSIAGEALSNKEKFWAGLGFFIIFITMLKPAESLYWLSGATCHALPNILLLFLLSLLFSSAHVLKPGVFYRKFAYYTISILLTFAIVGCNEIAAVTMLSVALLGVIITSYTNHSSKTLWRTIFLVAIICTYFTLQAPGNLVRTEEINVVDWSPDRVLIRALKGINSFRIYTTKWVLNPALLSATLISLPFLASLKRRIFLLESTKVNWLFFACYTALWLNLTLMPFVMPIVAVGNIPDRAINTGWFIFLVGWCIWILLLLCKLPEKDLSKLTVAKPIRFGAMIILLTSLLINSNFLHISKELVLDAPRYHSQILLRNKVINESIAAGDDSIEVDPVEGPSTLIFWSDTITEDPDLYANTCYSRTYNIRSIASKKKNDFKKMGNN